MSVTGRFATRSARWTDPLDLETAETVTAARDLDEQLRARPDSRLSSAAGRHDTPTPATPPGRSPPSGSSPDEPDITRERRSPAVAPMGPTVR